MKKIILMIDDYGETHFETEEGVLIDYGEEIERYIWEKAELKRIRKRIEEDVNLKDSGYIEKNIDMITENMLSEEQDLLEREYVRNLRLALSDTGEDLLYENGEKE